MWESLKRAPRGRISLRNFVMFFAMLLMATLLYSTSTTTSVNAAPGDAKWVSGAIVYDGRTHTLTDVSGATGLDEVPPGVDVYVTVQNLSTLSYAHVIFFAQGDDPSSAKQATYIRYVLNPPNTYSRPTTPQTIPVDPANAPVSATTSSTQTSCDVDGIGWMICPLSQYIAGGLDWMYGIVAEFLNVAPLTTSDGSLYTAWKFMRNVANLAFVLAFLVIIYYYIVGTVDAKYGIRTIVPRIVLVAVLVNVSYWIVAAAVDVSNILGYSVQQMFIFLREQVGAANSLAATEADWQTVTAIMLGGSVAGYAAFAGFAGATAIGGASMSFALIAALIPAMFAVFVAFIILAARQALITIFIIIAPLAFVAYLLPNTEEWFTRWRKFFVSLLIMFPAFSALFGGAQLAGVIIIQNAPNSKFGLVVVLLGLLVQVIPLFITPFLIRLSSGLLSTIAGMANDRSKGVFDRTKNWATDRRDYHKTRVMGNENPGAYRRAGNYYGMKQHHRERMKAAYQAQAEANYDRTRRGQRSYAEGQFGDNSKEAARQQNEELYQRRVAGDVHWGDRSLGERVIPGSAERQNARYAQLQHELHEGHAAGVRAGIIKDSIHDEGERHVREAIADAAPGTYNSRIRERQIQSVVDKGIAENATKQVTAQGNQRLADTVYSTASQRARIIQTQESEGRASQLNELVEDEAKAHWQELTLTDQTIYSRQLERQANAKQLKEYQDQWESILVEAGAGNTDDYVRRFGAAPAGVSATVAAIQAADEGIATEALRKERGDYISRVALNKRLKADPALLERAGGIDPEGKDTVLAKLQVESTNLYMENVGAAQSIFTNDRRYDLPTVERVYREGLLADGTKATLTQRHAAMKRIAEDIGNNYAVQDLSDFSQELGVIQQTDPATGQIYFEDLWGNRLTDDEVDTRRDTQQIIRDSINKGKNRVDWKSGTDQGLEEVGRYVVRDKANNTRTDFAGSELSIAREINSGKVDLDKALGSDIDVINKQALVLSKPDVQSELLDPKAAGQYADTLEKFLKDPLTGMKLEKRKRGSYHILLKELQLIASGGTIDLPSIETQYDDVATGETIDILDINKISTKKDSKRPTGPITLT